MPRIGVLLSPFFGGGLVSRLQKLGYKLAQLPRRWTMPLLHNSNCELAVFFLGLKATPSSHEGLKKADKRILSLIVGSIGLACKTRRSQPQTKPAGSGTSSHHRIGEQATQLFPSLAGNAEPIVWRNDHISTIEALGLTAKPNDQAVIALAVQYPLHQPHEMIDVHPYALWVEHH